MSGPLHLQTSQSLLVLLMMFCKARCCVCDRQGYQEYQQNTMYTPVSGTYYQTTGAQVSPPCLTHLIHLHWAGGCSSVGRASDQCAVDRGSLPRWGKGFCSRSQLSVQTLTMSVQYTPVCFCICARVKDPTVHVRVWWIMEPLKHPACTIGCVAQFCCSLLSPGKAT